MDCLEFRRQVGAQPALESDEIAAPRRDCPACARYQDELRAMDGLIARALAVNLDQAPPVRESEAPQYRGRWYAVAASVIAAVAVGAVLWSAGPRASVAREVIDHVAHEPGATAGTAPLAPGALAGVLDPEGTRLRPGVGDVTFAARCLIDGRIVPHLVVRRAEGTYTVLLLRHRQLDEPMEFDQEGYTGVVMPAPKGSIAIVSEGGRVPDGIAQQVFAALDYRGT